MLIRTSSIVRQKKVSDADPETARRSVLFEVKGGRSPGLNWGRRRQSRNLEPGIARFEGVDVIDDDDDNSPDGQSGLCRGGYR